jgi:hypothetical protein
MAVNEVRTAVRASSHLGDFTVTPRTITISVLAVAIGAISAFVALGLLKLIGLFTNLFFFQRWSTVLVSPAGNHLGVLEVLVPVGGAVIIGFMARYGSERIRGHGIPEAIEAILINGSRVEPRLAVLKPLSSAISIGSGGPFGAEGPIIMTGGAFGSMIAQFFHLTSAERKTLLVAGAAGGMSATFASPLAAVLLAVELLLFEWKPRSLVPVALASATAGAVRRYIIGLGPLFPVPAHSVFIGPEGLAGCVVAGILAGALSALLTLAVYAAEDLFQKHMPIHWMWWPAIGGLAVGLGEVVHLGLLAGLGNLGWSAGAPAHDGRRSRRPRGHGAAQRGRRFLAADQHGRHSGRHHALAVYGYRVRVRADTRHERDPAAAGGFRDCACVHIAHTKALHSDGEGRAPGLSSEPGVRGRSPGDSFRTRGDAYEYRGSSAQALAP